MSSTSFSHFLLLPFIVWGHIRPFSVLATRLVREQENIVVTFIVAPTMLEKTRAEISRQFCDGSPESSNALQRIRILSPCSDNAELFDMMNIFINAYPAAYRTLHQGKPITCAVRGTTFDALPAPSVVIQDSVLLPQLYATREISGHSVPVIAVIVAGAASIIRLFGPESIGGIGDFGAKADAEAARTGLSLEQIGDKMLRAAEGKLVQVAGLPAMYDYEFFPQKLPFDQPTAPVTRGIYGVLRECDALIVSTSYTYETASLDALKGWYSEMQKEVHVLGPFLPPSYGTETQKSEGGANNVDVEAFLGEMLIQHGKRSVFFVSFGTIYWPMVPEYVDELIEALIEKETPFIFAYASPFAKISEQQAKRIKSSGLGLLTTWSPQHFILNHPATGWFITHGGFNSVTESLGSGIPLICWPFDGDQPIAAAHLTENLNVGFELVQVRTGEALGKPMYKSGLPPQGTHEAVGIEIRQTIDLCRGEKGQEMRRNAEEIKVKFANAWEKDGIARREIRHFLQKYT